MSVDPVSLAITVALNAASMAMTASKQIEGPRLDDLKASTADYGTPMVQIYGTMRLECFCMYAEDLREERHHSKTKGGKYNEYKYFGTWASFIADCPNGPIDSVLKIWLDRHLIYQNTDQGATEAVGGTVSQYADLAAGATEAVGGQIRIYNGTATQMPDPRLAAKIALKDGSGCPAYRYIAYAVFEEIPLEKFGNRLPQVSMLPTRNEQPNYPWKFTPGGTTLPDLQVSRELGRVYNLSGDRMTIWDAATQTIIIDETFSHLGVKSPYAIVPGDGIYATGIAGDVFGFVGLDGGGGPVFPTFRGGPSVGWSGVFYAGGSVYLTPGSFTGLFIGLPSQGFSSVVDIPSNYYPTFYFTNIDGDAVGVGTDDSFGAANHLCIGIGLNPAVTVDTSAYGSSGAAYGFDNGTEYVIRQGAWLYRIDKGDYHIIQAANLPGSIHFTISNWNVIAPGAGDFYDGEYHYNARDLTLIDQVDTSLWLGSSRASELPGLAYEPTTNSLLSGDTFGDPGITWRFLRSSGGGWTLGDICADVGLQTGMKSEQFDFSRLDQNIPGFAWTQGAGKDIVGPLLDLHDSDIRPHGFILQGLKRGQPYSGPPIFTEWMVNESRGQDATSQPLYTIEMTSETDLPLRIAASFADPGMDDQPNTVHAQRNQASVQTNRETSFDLTTMRELPDTVQGLIERVLRRFWVGSTKPQFLLTPREIRLEAADVRPVVLEDGTVLRCRATKVVIRANRVIESEWEIDGETQVNPPSWTLDNANPLNAVYVTPPADGLGRTPDTLLTASPVKGFVFDTPLLRDADDQTAPLLYDAAGAFTDASFIGAMVFSATSDVAGTVFDGNFDAFESSEASVWGVMGSSLPDAVTDVMDEASVVTVTLVGGGTLASVTTDQLLANQALNLALIGGELVQFREADEIATNQYQLSGFIRGARNSEYAATGHAASENFLLIGSHVHKPVMGAGEIGTTDYYKFSSTGDDLDAASVITVPFKANAHRPPAPAHLALARDSGSGDWTISWIRRTRIGGGSVNGQDVPLGETSELYRVKIMSGASVLATYEVTTNQKVYTAAEQVADWSGVQSALTVEVCQMSPALSIEGFLTSASA